MTPDRRNDPLSTLRTQQGSTVFGDALIRQILDMTTGLEVGKD